MKELPTRSLYRKNPKHDVVESNRHLKKSEKEITFTGKREGEEKKPELVTPKLEDISRTKRRKLERSEDENTSSEDVEKITDTAGCSWQNESVGQQRSNTSSPMDLITFLEAIPASNRARKEAQKKREEEENGREKKVLKNIFRYLPFFSILNLTSANSNLYKFINQWNEIGATGLDIVVPDTSSIVNNLYKINQFYQHFARSPYTPKTIPSVVFYRIIQRASKLPKEYWPYLPKTSITEIDLIADDLTDEDFLTICNYLVDSKIKEIYLGYNNITDVGMGELIKAKKDLKGIQIKLKGNNISRAIQERVREVYPKVIWKF